MTAPKWDYREGFIRNKGADKFGNLVFHVPWTIGDSAAVSPDYGIVPKHGVWTFNASYVIEAAHGEWMWDRFVISSFPLTPDGRWQFYELILSKDHVPGDWAKRQWETDKAKIRVAYQSFEDAELRYATQKYREKFGWWTAMNSQPGRVMKWYRDGMGDKLPESDFACRVPTQQEMVNSRNNSLDKLMGYAMYCEPYRSQMIRQDMVDSYGKAGGAAFDTATTIAESSVGQFIAEIVGDTTGAVTVSEEDKDKFLKNRFKLPKWGDIGVWAVVLGSVGLLAYTANNE